MMKNGSSLTEKPWFLVLALIGLIGGAFYISSVARNSNSLLCSISAVKGGAAEDFQATSTQLKAILHYATTHVVPQQSLSEIRVTFDVLRSLGRPSNFLVFGLGHDSLMWEAINPGGTTLFLEEDPKWVQTVLKDAPHLQAHTVHYRTHLKEADRLLSWYRTEPTCSPERAYLRDNDKCKLALHNLPENVYDREWDLIMIDAPRGYFAEAPGRMAAIFSAAVMARNRKGSGVTHVFLHDVDRKVEKVYAEEFLCRKYRVDAVGRLWHFKIPSATNETHHSSRFC